MCTVLLPPGGYPIAVNKYIILWLYYTHLHFYPEDGGSRHLRKHNNYPEHCAVSPHSKPYFHFCTTKYVGKGVKIPGIARNILRPKSPDQPWRPPSHQFKCVPTFLRGGKAGRGVKLTTNSPSNSCRERVEVFHCSTYTPSWRCRDNLTFSCHQ